MKKNDEERTLLVKRNHWSGEKKFIRGRVVKHNQEVSFFVCLTNAHLWWIIYHNSSVEDYPGPFRSKKAAQTWYQENADAENK